ncbi:hypothetical protein ACLKA6_008113 [Drosophila palustris]
MNKRQPNPKGLSLIHLILHRRQRGFGAIDSIPGPADARSIANWISVQTLPIPVNFTLAEYWQSTATRLWIDDSIPGPAEGQFLLIRVALVTHSIMATTVDLWLHLADQQLQRNSWLTGTTAFYAWAPCVTCRQFIASEYRLPASSRHFQGWIRPSIDG